jgi:hypothetical protein
MSLFLEIIIGSAFLFGLVNSALGQNEFFCDAAERSGGVQTCYILSTCASTKTQEVRVQYQYGRISTSLIENLHSNQVGRK